MLSFQMYTINDAPPAAQPLLHRLARAFGFLPNLFAKLAVSQPALGAFLDLRSRYQRSSLSRIEQQVVLLAASVENNSPYCVSAHSFEARLAGIDGRDLLALRERRELPSPRLNALAEFSRTLVRSHGEVDDGDVNVMLAAGYTPHQLLDVVMGVSLGIFSNYASHLMRIPTNPELLSLRWIARTARASWQSRPSAVPPRDDATIPNRRAH